MSEDKLTKGDVISGILWTIIIVCQLGTICNTRKVIKNLEGTTKNIARVSHTNEISKEDLETVLEYLEAKDEPEIILESIRIDSSESKPVGVGIKY